MESVATIIRDQIRALDPRAMMAWGTKKLISNPKDKLGSLILSVGGCPKVKQRAFIRIALDFNDTYIIEAYRIRGVDKKVIAYHEGIYCDQLVEVIDEILG
jgi:hypothetical protein